MRAIPKNNKGLLASKGDEFYTRLEDVVQELDCYPLAHQVQKVVCPCDGSDSAFVQYFKKRGTLTSSVVYGCTPDKPFESDEMLHAMAESDLVATNPPFSRFLDFYRTLKRLECLYIIVAPVAQLLSNDVFPDLQSGEAWVGFHHLRWFEVPKGYEHSYGHRTSEYDHLNRGANGYKFDYERRNDVVWLTNIGAKPEGYTDKFYPARHSVPEQDMRYLDNTTGDAYIVSCETYHDVIADSYLNQSVPTSILEGWHGRLAHDFELVYRGKDIHATVDGKEPFQRVIIRKKI
jgi:hypothetical protein